MNDWLALMNTVDPDPGIADRIVHPLTFCKTHFPERTCRPGLQVDGFLVFGDKMHKPNLAIGNLFCSIQRYLQQTIQPQIFVIDRMTELLMNLANLRLRISRRKEKKVPPLSVV